MSHFEFNPQERNFPIYGAAERSYPVKEPIDYRLWIVELIYVYSIGKEMILNEYVDQKVFRTAYRQWGAAKNDQPIDGWFQFDYVLDLAEETEKQFTVIG